MLLLLSTLSRKEIPVTSRSSLSVNITCVCQICWKGSASQPLAKKNKKKQEPIGHYSSVQHNILFCATYQQPLCTRFHVSNNCEMYITGFSWCLYVYMRTEKCDEFADDWDVKSYVGIHGMIAVLDVLCETIMLLSRNIGAFSVCSCGTNSL